MNSVDQETQDLMEKRFRGAEIAMGSMTFDNSTSTDERPTIVQPQREVPDGGMPGVEPISAYAQVTRETENVICINHETDPAKNVRVTI